MSKECFWTPGKVSKGRKGCLCVVAGVVLPKWLPECAVFHVQLHSTHILADQTQPPHSHDILSLKTSVFRLRLLFIHHRGARPCEIIQSVSLPTHVVNFVRVNNFLFHYTPLSLLVGFNLHATCVVLLLFLGFWFLLQHQFFS